MQERALIDCKRFDVPCLQQPLSLESGERQAGRDLFDSQLQCVTSRREYVRQRTQAKREMDGWDLGGTSNAESCFGQARMEAIQSE